MYMKLSPAVMAVLFLLPIAGTAGCGDSGNGSADLPRDASARDSAGDIQSDVAADAADASGGDGVEPDNAGPTDTFADALDDAEASPVDSGTDDFEDPGLGDLADDGVELDADADSALDSFDSQTVDAGDVAPIQDAVTLGCAPTGPAAPVVDCAHPVEYQGGTHQTCVVVPEGQCHTFWMGAVPNELYIVPMQKEVPRRMVHLTGYRMSKYLITVAEYRACVQNGPCRPIPANSCLANPMAGDLGLAEPNLSDDAKLNHPVDCVSYADAETFCGWLGGELPSEARFEYAAAGPMTDANQIVYFPWGSNLDSEGSELPDQVECHANIKGTTAWGDPFPQTSPVGFFDGGLKTRAQGGWIGGPDTYQTCDDTGPFGTRDMTHNVLVFLKDGPTMYRDLPEGQVDPEIDPVCEGVTVRATSWRYEDMVHTRVTNRHFICLVKDNMPEGVPFSRNVIRSNDIGFRCAFDR